MSSGMGAAVGERVSLGVAQAPGLALYALTLAGQLAGAFARGLIVTVTLKLVGWIAGWSIPAETIGWVVAFAPLAASALCVICPALAAPISGRWWEISCGGRPPEDDELEAFTRAIAQLQRVDPRLRPPRHWFVAEDDGCNAAAYASSMRVDRGLLESPYAAAVIAHELGHLRSSDATLTGALNALLLWPMATPAVRPLHTLAFRGLAWFACGQAVLWFTANSWEAYWRSRELAADEFAARLGQGAVLAASLEEHALSEERPVARMRFSRESHPYTKPRIARLRALAQRGVC